MPLAVSVSMIVCVGLVVGVGVFGVAGDGGRGADDDGSEGEGGEGEGSEGEGGEGEGGEGEGGGGEGEGGDDGEGQGTSCWVPAATKSGHVDLHPGGEHVTVVAPLMLELEYEQLDVAVPAEVS